jgi:hypothetical protein
MIINLMLIVWAAVSTGLAVWYRYDSEHSQQMAEYWYERNEQTERRVERLRAQRNRSLALLKEARDERVD